MDVEIRIKIHEANQAIGVKIPHIPVNKGSLFYIIGSYV